MFKKEEFVMHISAFLYIWYLELAETMMHYVTSVVHNRENMCNHPESNGLLSKLKSHYVIPLFPTVPAYVTFAVSLLINGCLYAGQWQRVRHRAHDFNLNQHDDIAAVMKSCKGPQTDHDL